MKNYGDSENIGGFLELGRNGEYTLHYLGQ